MAKLVIPLDVFRVPMTTNKRRRIVKLTLNEWIEVHGKRKGRVIAASYKKRIQARIIPYVAQAMVDGLPPIDKHMKFHFSWYFQDKRTDLDNWTFTHKFIFDAFQTCSVRGQVFMPNDNLAYVVATSDDFMGVDKEHPRVEIDWRDTNESRCS